MPERRVGMIRIEIEDRLEDHVRQAVESDRIAPKPAPGQPGILPAAEAVLPGTHRIGVVQICLDRPIAFRDLRVPIGHDRAVHPGHDVLARVVLQRANEPFAGCCGGRRIPATVIRGSVAARAGRNRHEHEEHVCNRNSHSRLDWRPDCRRRERYSNVVDG